MATAIIVDCAFFLRRYRYLKGGRSATEADGDLHKMCLEHLNQDKARKDLYRILVYDCPPLSKKVHHPITKKSIDFSTTPTAKWRLEFHAELKKLRKVALRLGYLSERWGDWRLKPDKLKQLLAGTIKVEELQEEDVSYDVGQKGVDMKIGLDIASLTYKRLVDQIILVSGDSDFVPAAKLARRDGIDFVLDPMWAPIRADLHEHIDGLRTVFPRPQAQARKPVGTP